MAATTSTTSPTAAVSGGASARPDRARHAAAPGLRERKKQRTRDALVTAAQRLFSEQGYEQTTTDQIAAAVDVSQRTLFRYFANKDDVALAPLDELQDDLFAALRARPADEPPMSALRAAARQVLHEVHRSAGADRDVLGAAGSTIDLVQRTPALLAANLRRMSEREDQLAAVIAERTGVDPDTDIRPRLAVATFDAALRMATTRWCVVSGPAEKSLDGIADALEACLDAQPHIFGPWHTPHT